MDYKTKPTSRTDLRRYSKILRRLFGVPLTGSFPVLEVLERLGDVFDNCNYIVVVLSGKLDDASSSSLFQAELHRGGACAAHCLM